MLGLIKQKALWHHWIFKMELRKYAPVEKTKQELAIIDKLSEWLLLHCDVSYEIGMLVYAEYDGMGRILDIAHRPNEKDEDKETLTKHTVKIQIEWLDKKLDQYNPQWQSMYDILQYDSKMRPIRTTQDEYFAEIEALANKSIGMNDLLAIHFPDKSSEQETGVMIMNRDVLLSRKKDLLAKQDFMKVRARAVKNLLEKRMQELRVWAAGMEGFIAKLNKLIWSIELYLGIKEELIGLQQGISAPADEPICFRQRRLYMDEEVGDPMADNQGLDFKKIDTFDNWLLQRNDYHKKFNYEFIIPEQKSVVILKVRRNDKQYTDNPWVNGMMNQPNHLTYVLIRNGENLYRIYADIVIGENFFPDQDELTELVQKVNGEFDFGNDRWHK